MVLDRNPKFAENAYFETSARKVTDLLWETTGGDPSKFPVSYLETLRHDYSDGKVSMLELMDRIDLGENATYEDYCEVVDKLICVDSSAWPNPSSITEVQTSKLLYEIEPEFNFSEFDFADEVIEEEVAVGEVDTMSDKMETFLKKVISSVYLDGVTEVTDVEGNPPNSQNNYLLSEDGKTFQGIFYDSPPNESAKKFPFQITEGADNQWSIKY
jgi:hypothetical protein